MAESRYQWVPYLSGPFTMGFGLTIDDNLTRRQWCVKLIACGFWAIELTNWFLFQLGLFPTILYLEGVIGQLGLGLDSLKNQD